MALFHQLRGEYTMEPEDSILQYRSGKVYCTDTVARVLLEKTVDGKKWIRHQFKNRQELLKYKRVKNLA